MTSWTENDECHVQDDGVTDFKPGNLETRAGTVTLFGKVKRLKKFRKQRKGHDKSLLITLFELVYNNKQCF